MVTTVKFLYYVLSCVISLEGACVYAQSLHFATCKLQPTRLFHPWDSPGKITGVGYRALCQQIFPTQRSNPHLLSSPALQAASLLLIHQKAHHLKVDYHKMKVKNESESCSVMSNSLQSHGLYSLWNSPGQNTGVGSLSLLQGVFTTQGLNPGLLHCRWILYQLSHIDAILLTLQKLLK